MNENQTKNTYKENIKKARRYLSRYLGELKMHLELQDQQITKILEEIYNDFKKKDTTKKWWNFFLK